MSRSEPRALALPGLILGSRPFLGASGISKDADLDCLVRFAAPRHGAGLVTAAARQGFGAIAPMNDAAVLGAIDLAAAPGIEVFPIIPNAIGYVRDATDHGMIGAGLKHLRRLGLGDLIGIGLRGIASAPLVLKKDFVALLRVLIDVEMAAFKRYRPRLVLLHGQMTDVATALGNRAALRAFADVIRSRYGAEPGLVTNNFGTLVPRLEQWGIDIRVVVAPFNPRGFLMKPSREACERLLAAGRHTVIADRLVTGREDSLADAFAYLRDLGIASAIVDVSDQPAITRIAAAHSVPPAVRPPETYGISA